jgi:hypothetical protein
MSQGRLSRFTPLPSPANKLKVQVTQGNVTCEAEALITITSRSCRKPAAGSGRQGSPFIPIKSAGRTWRSKFDAEQNVIVINNGHRDFVFVSRARR